MKYWFYENRNDSHYWNSDTRFHWKVLFKGEEEPTECITNKKCLEPVEGEWRGWKLNWKTFAPGSQMGKMYSKWAEEITKEEAEKIVGQELE